MERLTYDFCFNGSHSNQVKGADNLTCSEVCEREESCNECPIARAFDRLAAIEDILGDEYDLAHLRELIQADRDGRCAVLPCKPSDITVYQLRGKKHALGVGVHPRHIYCATVWANGRYQLEHQGQEPCLDKDFGKTWFLKEEEAKAALEKVKKG